MELVASLGLFHGIWSDMYIETTFMRYGNRKGSIIGITLKSESLKVLGLVQVMLLSCVW